MAQLFVFHDELGVVFCMEWGSGAALPEGVEGEAEEVGQRLQFREADVLGAAEIGHGLLALLEESGDELLLLLARQLGVETVNEFDVQHCIFAFGVNNSVCKDTIKREQNKESPFFFVEREYLRPIF